MHPVFKLGLPPSPLPAVFRGTPSYERRAPGKLQIQCHFS